jgi:hypothetical protein
LELLVLYLKKCTLLIGYTSFAIDGTGIPNQFKYAYKSIV